MNRRTQLGRSDEASFKVSAECPNLKHAALSLTQNSGSINIANIRASFNQPTRQRLSGPYHDVTFGLSVETYHNESGEAMLFISAITTRRNPVLTTATSATSCRSMLASFQIMTMTSKTALASRSCSFDNFRIG